MTNLKPICIFEVSGYSVFEILIVKLLINYSWTKFFFLFKFKNKNFNLKFKKKLYFYSKIFVRNKRVFTRRKKEKLFYIKFYSFETR